VDTSLFVFSPVYVVFGFVIAVLVVCEFFRTRIGGPLLPHHHLHHHHHAA
jgi:hypothetical protein